MLARRIAFYGPRAAGKTTAAQILALELKNCIVLSSAAPLYRLQALAYEIAGLRVANQQQDATTLAAMADVLRRLDQDILAKIVVQRVSELELSEDVSIAICPDSRLKDRSYLAASGFEFVYFSAKTSLRRERRQLRGDIGVIDDANDPDCYFEGDPRIVNDGTVGALRYAVLSLF